MRPQTAKSPMRVPLLHAATMLLVLALGLTAHRSQAQSASLPPTITIQATGQVAVAPDMATVTLGVAHHAKTARAAVDSLNADLARILGQLSDLGIADSDIQTTGLRLSPRQDYARSEKPRNTGFDAVSDISVRVRDLDRLGVVLDSVVTQGANLFRGLTYGLADPGPMQDAARQAAVAEALRLAALFADAADVPLGPLLTLSEVNMGRGQPMMMMGAARLEASGSVPTASGEITLEATVVATFGSPSG